MPRGKAPKKVDKEKRKRVQKRVTASKKASDFVKKIANQPMGPGQSMAMAGNTGLAGFSPNQVEEIKKGQEAINQFKGNTSEPVTYQEIGQQIGEMGSKYRRPVNYDRYADRMRMLNEGIAAGGKFFIGPDGIPRFSFMGGDNVVRDAAGKQFLSMMLPELTASAPTLSQLGGDISRAFTGYDSIKYPDQNFQGPFPSGQNVNTAFMQTTPGMFSNINPLSVIPGVGMAMKIGQGIKSGVEAAWDAVRGEPTSAQGTAFPQPSSDTKDLFSSIDTGIAASDPDNLLVQIAKANEGRFDDKPTFQEQLANATAMNLNIPSPTDIVETISDYATSAAQGVDVDTPIGKVNLNPLAQKVFLDGGIGDIKYGGSLDPNTLDYNVGVGAQLPYGVNFSAGTSSNDIPGMSFNKNIGPVNTSFNLSEQGGSLGLNTVVDPLQTIFPGSAIGTPINIGASVDSKGNVTPNINLMVPFNSGGLGYMFK